MRVLARLALPAVVGLLGSAGCALDLRYDGAAFRCEAGACPDGQACVDGVCVASGGDGGVDPALACGSVSYLGDTFDSTELPAWESWFEEARVEVSGGDLVFTVETADADGYAEISTLDAYDLTAGAVEIDVLETGAVATWFYVTHVGGGVAAEIKAEGGNLLFLFDPDPALEAGPDVSVTYDPADHRYWRFAGQGGRLTWETSPDRAAWTVQRDEAMPPGLAFATVRIGVWDDGTATSRVGSINPTAPPVQWCGAEQLDDVFGGTEIAPFWRVFSYDICSVALLEGELAFTINGPGAWCAIRPQRPVDLREGELGFRVQRLDAFTRFEVKAGDDTLVMQADAATGVVASRNGAGLASPVPLADAQYWRMTMRGDTVRYEVSADGLTYDAVVQANGVTGLAEARVELAVSGDEVGAVVLVDDIDGEP